MKKSLLLFTFFLIFLLSGCVDDRSFIVIPEEPPAGDLELMYYWNFNNEGALLTANQASGNYLLTYSGVWDPVNEGSELNARFSDPPGSALRLRNPAGVFKIKVSTEGYRNLIMKFAATRTNNGAQENIISYSTDGVNFVSAGLSQNVITITPEYVIYSIDFSMINAVNNLPELIIKFDYNIGNTNPTGNNRYDNLTIEGVPIR